ncbi:MAG: 50S ribosomal protein L11 methyltransferase [Myxococcota bacterium]
MSTDHDGPAEPWATIRIQATVDGIGNATDEVVDRLDTLGLLLADEAAVGGVERRDAGTLVDAPQPEQWAYTTPEGLEAVLARITTLAASLGLWVTTQVEIHHDDDWRESWKRFYQPRILGDGALLLRPSWIERRPGDPPREVVLDPGRAFGTGLHESTRLCLRRLCAQWAEGQRPATVLDLGCGSGILVLAAARLFAKARLWARDLDPEAVQTTDENATLNGLRERIDLDVGTIDDLPLTPLSLTIANIRPEVLVPAAPAIRRRMAPGGRVLLSGILVEEAPAVRAAYEAQGLAALPPMEAPDLVDNEWQAIELLAP